MLSPEYFSLVVNVLTNSRKISDHAKADFFQFNLTLNSWKNRLIVVPCSFHQFLEPVNTLITEWCSEARPFRRLSNHLFPSQ